MSASAPHITLRRLTALAVVAAAFAVPSAAQGATSAPTVAVDVGARSIDVTAADDLGRGPIRLEIAGERLADSRGVAVVALDEGVTLDDIEETGIHTVDTLEDLGRLVAGGRVDARTGHTTTIVAEAGDYAVVDVSVENAGIAGFTVADDHNGARIPKTDATIGLRDRGFYLPSLLPRDGRLRISNQGDLIHQASAYRLKRTTSYREAVRAAYRGLDLERYGTSTVLTGAVSGGAVNRVDVSLRAGRYLLVSEYTPFTLGALSDIDRGLVATTRVR